MMDRALSGIRSAPEMVKYGVAPALFQQPDARPNLYERSDVMSVPEGKRCSKCGEVKEREAFSAHPQTSDRLQSWCRACTAAMHRAVAAAKGPVRLRAERHARYELHQEEIKVAVRQHRQRRKAAGLPVTQRTPEGQQRAYERTAVWVQENRDALRAYFREYYRKFPDKKRVYEAVQRAIRTGAGGTFTVEEWIALCNQYGNVCLACGSTDPLTVDHIVPIVKGGRSDIANLQPLCKPCNTKKRVRIIDYRPVQEPAL